MKEVLAEAEAALAAVQNWTQDIRGAGPEVRAYKTRAFIGSAGGWNFVIVDFDIEDQGFPPGTRGYDGVARHDGNGVVLHLPRELAQKGLAAVTAICGG